MRPPQADPGYGSLGSILGGVASLATSNRQYQPWYAAGGQIGGNILGQILGGSRLDDIMSSPSLWSPVLGTLGGYLGRGTPYAPLLSGLGTAIGSQLPNLLSGSGLNVYQLTDPKFLGNIGSAIGTLLAPQNQWAAPIGRLAGTIASPILRGENLVDFLGRPSLLQGIGGSLGSIGGNRLGGALGTIGGNVIGNIISGISKGQDLSNILGSIGSAPNLANLGTGLLSFLLPQDMHPVAKSIISTGASLIAPSIAGMSVPTIGSALGSLGASIAPAIASIPVAVAALPLALGLSIWYSHKAAKKARKADEKETYRHYQKLKEATAQAQPLYDAILEAGKQRMEAVNQYIDNYINYMLYLDPFMDVEAKRKEILNKLGIVDPTYGFTAQELALIFGIAELDPWRDVFTAPAIWSRSSYSKHYAKAPWTVAQGMLVEQPGLDYSKIIPWLNARTLLMANYGHYMTNPQFKSEIDKMLEEYAPRPLSVAQKIIDAHLAQKVAEAERQVFHDFALSNLP